MKTPAKSAADRVAGNAGATAGAEDLRRRLAEAEERAVRSEEALRDADQAIRTLQEQLNRAHRMQAIGTLAAGIAHDVNNMMGAILGYTSLLKNRMRESHPTFRALDTIERSAERTAELTGKLLGFARGGKYRAEPVSLNEVVDRVIPIVRGTFPKSIVVTTSLSRDLPPTEGDIGQLEHSLLNLCLNARDAMPSGGALHVETLRMTIGQPFLALHPWARTGDFVRLSVSDTGKGMAEETKKRVFEPFFTAKKSGAQPWTGTGLAMVYDAVKSHGGFIEVHSAPGEGSLLRLYLPVSWRAGDPFLPEGAGSVRGKTRKILVVDDEPSLRDLAEAILGSAGYEVVPAENGEEACRMLRREQKGISLALLDIDMPGMGGRETFLMLRGISPALPVVVATGHGIEGSASEILQAGGAGFLGKPYRRDDLLKAVRGALSK